MKRGKKMKGLMCHSPGSTAVCMSHDYRSAVIQPGKRPHTSTALHLHHLQLLNNTSTCNYIPLQPPAPSASPPISHNLFQVVVMRVSIHCQGCAGKVKKHLSKMEGVTSFSIDLESKRVTVMGHVSPSDVVESISKVKKAQLWSS